MGSSPGRTSVALGWILAAALVFVAAAGLALVRGFDGLYGQDAFGYVNYALGPLREAMLHGEALPAFEQPPGFPMVVAAASLVVGPDGRIGLGVSLVAGALVPVLTGLLAVEALAGRLSGRAAVSVPLAAAGVAALPGQLWQSSAVAMSDTLSIALATAGAWAVCRFVRTERTRWLLLAAVLVSAAIETRWVFGLVAIPIGVVGLIGLRRVWGRDRRAAIGGAIGAVVIGAVVLAPVGLPMAHALLDGSAVPFAADFGAYHWDALNALRTTFDTNDGRLVHPLPSGIFYLGQAVAPYWFGPLGLLAIWGGTWVVRRAGLVAATVLVGWPVLVVVFLAGSPYQNTRFFLSALPPVAVLIALGLWRAAVAIRRRNPPDRRRVAAVIGGALVVVWVAGAIAVAGRFTDAFIVRQVADLTAIRSLEAQVPAGARVISMGPTGVFVRDGVPDVVELFDLDPAVVSTFIADPPPSYLVIDADAIAGQWAGLGPARTVEAIRASRGLTRIDEAGAWTLYRIGSP